MNLGNNIELAIRPFSDGPEGRVVLMFFPQKNTSLRAVAKRRKRNACITLHWPSMLLTWAGAISD
jgi:hypothetical protein